jgi:uncharacterized protein YecE (DUF72 family)
MGNIYTGISGWTYDGWRRRFYPEGLARGRQLEFAARQFNAIEINGTFYRLQRPENFSAWREQTPAGFRFAVKGSRFITHMKQLRDVRTPLANFFASGVLRLEDRLGPLLWQFPRRMRFDPARFDAFLDMLPRSERQASTLARHHDARVSGRASFHTHSDRPIRHAVEVRHESFFCDEFIRMLRRHHAALVLSDAGSEWPYAEDVTADFVYVRLHWCRGAVRERLWRGRARPLGPARARVGRRHGAAGRTARRQLRRDPPRGARRVRLLRQRCEGARAVRCLRSRLPPRPRLEIPS